MLERCLFFFNFTFRGFVTILIIITTTCRWEDKQMNTMQFREAGSKVSDDVVGV